MTYIRNTYLCHSSSFLTTATIMLFGSSTLPRFAYNSKWFGRPIPSVFNEPNTGACVMNIPPQLDEYLLNPSTSHSDDSLSLSLSQDTSEQTQDDLSSKYYEDDHILIIGSQQHHIKFGQGFVSDQGQVDDEINSNEIDLPDYTSISRDSCSTVTGSIQSKIDDNTEVLKSASIVKELAAILIQSASIDEQIIEQKLNEEFNEFIAVKVSFPQSLKVPSASTKPLKSILKTNKSFKTPGIDLIQKSAKFSSTLTSSNSQYCNTIKKHQVTFDSRVYIGEAVPPSDYERRGDYIARCLTPELAFFIKRELNEVKREMKIHECSIQNTQFYSV